ncbi:MAG: sulfotransferase family protein [Gammaproteobacteria bacterium]
MRICLWSGPRNVSTALMYSFAQRPDTAVLDEPLYGHYLRISGAIHPGRADVLSTTDTDGDSVMRRLVEEPADRPVLFMKQMAHHLVGLDLGFLARTSNVLLIRDPREMLPSLTRELPHAGLADTGLARQHRLFDDLRGRGREPPVLDAGRLLANPPGVLRSLCARLGLPFDTVMLHWPPGPKPYDGVWARHWYANVHGSTGFAAPRPRSRDFPDALRPLLEECRVHYHYLLPFAIA